MLEVCGASRVGASPAAVRVGRAGGGAAGSSPGLSESGALALARGSTAAWRTGATGCVALVTAGRGAGSGRCGGRNADHGVLLLGGRRIVARGAGGGAGTAVLLTRVGEAVGAGALGAKWGHLGGARLIRNE